MSYLAALPVEQRTICVEAEFDSRADGLGPLLDLYGVPRGSADGVPDENISIYCFPAYNAAAVLNTETLETYLELEDICGAVSEALTDEALRELNLRVDEGGELPADVALDVVVQEGFVTEP